MPPDAQQAAGAVPGGPTTGVTAGATAGATAVLRDDRATGADPTPAGRGAPVARVLVALAVVAGVVLRFLAPPDLWLDEAQSVAIARLPPGQLLDALREDGAPPLYYLLLHGWTGLVGEGSVQVRALSGLFSVLSLPVAWALGRRLGGPRTGTALLVLLACSPFAVRYATETRMYALVVLLVLLGAAAVDRAVRHPGAGGVLAVGAVAGALLLTHYWAAFLLAAVGLTAVAGLRRYRRPATRVLAGLVLGALAFLPWLPSFLQQLAHTGTPWAAEGGLRVVTAAFGSWQGGGSVGAALLGHLLVVLLVLSVTTVPLPGAGRRVRLGLTGRRVRWSLLAVSVGTLLVAAAVSALSASAVTGRYTSVAFPAALALAAVGAAALPSDRAVAAVLSVAALLGLGVAGVAADRPRTQAGEVADALADDAAPGDVVVFCPDQLGPSVARLAPPGLRLVGYPGLQPAGRVDWTDYAERTTSADPTTVATAVDALAGAHAVWVVTGRGYLVPSDADCRDLRTALTGLRGPAEEVVGRRPEVGEGMRVHLLPAT